MSDRLADASLAALSTDELRAAIRAVLRDLVPPTDPGDATRAVTAGQVERVTVRTDAELDAFVRRLAALCEDATQRRAVRDGHRRFQLVAGGDGTGTAPPAGGVVRVDRGAVTERRVKSVAAQGARLVVGPKAVLTPLARDRARTLGVIVEREY